MCTVRKSTNSRLVLPRQAGGCKQQLHHAWKRCGGNGRAEEAYALGLGLGLALGIPSVTQTYQLILDAWVPEAQAIQVMQQVLVHDGEFARQHAPHVDVGGVRLRFSSKAQVPGDRTTGVMGRMHARRC